MKINSKYIIGIALAILTACTKYIYVYSVGEADNAIVLSAGVIDKASGVRTKAAEDNHSKHVAFTQNTKIVLRVDGTWTDHDPVDIKKKTVATLGAESEKHNPLSTYDPSIYWDDYGTADPRNSYTGRTQGLSIYGAAVNGKTTLPATLSGLDATQSTWGSLPWNVGSAETPVTIDQKTSGWGDYDLLTSNNVKSDDSYKFTEKSTGKLLEFTHAMTKITVQLTAGEGFPRTNASDPATAHFEAAPDVTLKAFYYKGTVNVESKTSTPNSSTADILMHHYNDGAAHVATLDALVFPNIQFEDNTRILTLSADGNEYHVTAAKLNAAIKDAIVNHETTNYPTGSSNLSSEPKVYDLHLLQAWNYKLIITVNKTGVDVVATIKDWDEVEAENEAPVIVITTSYGHDGTDFAKSFDFYRSQSVTGSYVTGIDKGNHTVVNFVAETADPAVPAHYTMTPQLYWPDHSTPYFFRGIWPLVDSTDGESQPIGPAMSQVKANSIVVTNAAYKQGYYPSDLMIGIPRKDDGTYDEPDAGITATRGKIKMNFKYAMSQVVVNLTTSEGDDKVDFDEHTVVEILSCYTSGEIKLSDESSDFTGKTATDYTMNRENDGVHTTFHDAIIPQSLEDGSHNPTLKFRITVKQGDSYDKYETILGIKDIPVNGDQRITSWEPGKKYIYNLTVTKSDIKVEARITDWTTTEGGTTIWM